MCFKCPFKEKCPHAGIEVSIENHKPSENTVKDLLIYIQALNDYEKPEDSEYRRWTAAYKIMDSVVACINDLEIGGQETK